MTLLTFKIAQLHSKAPPLMQHVLFHDPPSYYSCCAVADRMCRSRTEWRSVL